jgi:hypothetical protein
LLKLVTHSNYYEVVAAFAVAMILTLFFSLVLRNRGPWGALWLVFVIIFLATWAAHLWVQPAGPMVLGVSVLPIVSVGLIFAFILAAASLPRNVSAAGTGDINANAPAATAISIFFWVLVILLVVAIASGYFRLPVENSKQLVK